MKIERLLVANRGEIAIRVLRAASELRIRTVAVYTYEDRYSLHRYKADEAYQIGEENEPLKPYLDIEELIRTAKKYRINAIHPGYGFLSENVQFARRCREEGIIFVGPSPEVMEQLGDKVKAKAVAKAVDVPIIESNQERLGSVAEAQAAGRAIGYPVLLKAASGGGGRGMRTVADDEQMAQLFPTAQREAKNAFGDDTIFIEKFIADPKHIEVQILGDQHGNVLHLYERDCSVQRRFQKVVEVAPAPNLRQETKDALYEYALRIARHVQYDNAGTVEFLVDKAENIFFIEVNPRIQVEHTVTEEVTGIDIVRSQILIAAGRSLHSSAIFLRSQADVQCQGFAIQCRLTTEDPEDDFKPDYGTVVFYRNAGGFGIRIDEGSSYSGVRISPFFDSLLAKVTASGRTLKGATQRLHRTLTEFRVRGVKTNKVFLENVILHPEFQAGRATVNFIAEYREDLFNFRRPLDRGTKLLRYLAQVTVNGNPSVKHVEPGRTFRTPRVPTFDRFGQPAPGTKQRLEALGADGFAQWLRAEKRVHVTDTTFRDAHQSLLATRVRTRDMLLVAEGFAKHHPQTFSMEVWGGATFDVAMRFLYEDPWQRLRQFRAAMPNVLLQMLLRGANAVGYTAYPDNLVQVFIEKSAEEGIDVFRIFDSLNWLENMKASIRTVRERTGALAEACICYTGDISDPRRTKYTLAYYVDMAKALEDAGAHILAIKDMAGLLKPYAAAELVAALREAVQLPVHLHTHDTSAAQLATYVKAIEAGVDVVDVAIGSMSGLTSQPNFNTLNAILQGHERAPDFDQASLEAYAQYWEAVRDYYYPFESGLKAGTAEVYMHEIPGGQYSNLRPQAASMGLGDRMPEVTQTYQAVNQLFGDIVKVTPSSKVVGDMALFLLANHLTVEDVITRGASLDFPESVRSFFRGELGQPTGGFPIEIQKIVLKDEQPFTDRPNAHLEPIDLEGACADFRQRFPERPAFTDFLSHQLYPKVFEDFYAHYVRYGDVSVVPTPEFFYGMKANQEVLIPIDEGKSVIIRLNHLGEPNEDGIRLVNFRLNGQARSLEVRDQSIKVEKVAHAKAKAAHEVGAPLQGMLSKVFVTADQEVTKGTPLFVIEAMKMETTVTAPRAGKVVEVVLPEATLVDAEDLVVRLEA